MNKKRKRRMRRKVRRAAPQGPALPPSCARAATALTPSTGMFAQHHLAGPRRASAVAQDSCSKANDTGQGPTMSPSPFIWVASCCKPSGGIGDSSAFLREGGVFTSHAHSDPSEVVIWSPVLRLLRSRKTAGIHY
jgi:hypothetical protein